MTSFTRSIIQADQLGISLARVLRVQAQDLRNKRQMAAEQKAMKAPIKMLFPTVLFIFPAMFIVILGPAMMTLLQSVLERRRGRVPGSARAVRPVECAPYRATWPRG